MRRALAIAALLGLAACAATTTNRSYTLGRSVAGYDELKRATDKCTADGGQVRPKDVGGDPTVLSNYTCVISKGK